MTTFVTNDLFGKAIFNQLVNTAVLCFSSEPELEKNIMKRSVIIAVIFDVLLWLTRKYN